MVVAIIGACRTDGSCASGTASEPAPSFGFHCLAPAGLSANSHSYPKSVSKKLLSQVIGVGVQAPSSPLVIVSLPLPLPKVFFQPSPWLSRSAPSGSGPTYAAAAAPWVLPNVWPPAMSATVSSSFMAIRPNVSRMSRAAASGSGRPFGPSGLT